MNLFFGIVINLQLNHDRLIRHRQIKGSRRCAIATANLLISVVAAYRPGQAETLSQRMLVVCKKLVTALPAELVVSNIAHRVLGLVRDATESGKGEGESSSNEQIDGTSSETADEPQNDSTAKEDVLDGIRELLDELDQADKQISEYANEHVFPEETILVIGASLTVQKFLLDAAKRRKFKVFHVEGYPDDYEATHDIIMNGVIRDYDEPVSVQNRLRSLSAAGVSVTAITDSQVFAVMPLVNKVVLSAQGLFSNGGFLTRCGGKSLAKVAQFHRVPIIVLAPVYRLSPSFPYDPSKWVTSSIPSRNIAFQDGPLSEKVLTTAYEMDYAPPELASLFVTNM